MQPLLNAEIITTNNQEELKQAINDLYFTGKKDKFVVNVNGPENMVTFANKYLHERCILG